MTLLVDDGSTQPGAHVLLVGVGDYPFLKGGSAAQPFALHMNMGQLSSPPQSVQDIAAWFADGASGFYNPERPLRSLQVLCSATPPVSWSPLGTAAVEIARARMPAVRQAVLDWMARANRNPENLAVFYFCGHGIAFGEAQNALLLEDFGGNTADPMADAIAFDEMRLGLMRHCAARYQCHFVDACRTPPTRDFEDTYGDASTGVPIVAAGLSRKLRDKVAPVYFATGLASAAYGLKDQPSLFTQGLLRSLRGSGSRDADDHWEVRVPALAEGINKCVESLAFQVQPQYCQPRDTGQDFMLHRLRGEPEVVVKVYTRNESALPTARLTITNDATQARLERQPLPTPWWVSVVSGPYTFEAVAAGAQVPIGQRRKHVAPPGAEVGL